LLFPTPFSELASKIVLKPEVAKYLFSNEQLAAHILPLILKTTYFESIIELLIDNLGHQKSNLIEMFALSSSVALKNNAVNKGAIEKLLIKSLEKYKSNGWEDLYGSAHYNLANFYRAKSKFKESLRHYCSAKNYEPEYLERDYYHREIAGTLFELGRYKLSANSYKKAIELGEERFDMALCADALMYSGQYKEALDLLTEYMKDNCDVSPSWELKFTFLDSLIENIDVERQVRAPKKAVKYIDVDKEGSVSQKNCEEALELDYLCGLAWFNLGWYYYQKEDIKSAQLCYMSCAILQPRDIEAWINAIKLGFSNETPIGLLPHMISVGYHHRGEEFLHEVHKLVENIPSDNRDAFLQMISEHLLELEQRLNRKELRIIGADKEVIDVLSTEE